MTARSKSVIKTYFETGDRPTQTQFADLIDSYQDANSNLTALASAGTGSVGLQVLAATTTAAAQNVLGGGTVGKQIFQCVTTAAAQAIVGGGDMTKAIYDPANIAQQLVGTTAAQSLTNKTINGVSLTTGGVATEFLNGTGTYSAPISSTVSSQSSTSGTAIDFTGIPEGVTKIEVIFNSVSLSGSDNLLIQIGDSGGIETSGYLSSGNYGGASATSTSGFVIKTNASGDNHSGIVSLINYTGNTWVSSGVVRPNQGTGSDGSSVGDKALSATLDRIRITVTGANNFDGGAVAIRY